jgi:hypothetical protein
MKGRGSVRSSALLVRRENSMNVLQEERQDDEQVLTVRILHAHRHWWTRLKVALSASSPKGVAALRRAWRRSWLGGVVWLWLRREAEIVAKVAGVVTLSLWLKRLNESILRGEMSDVVRDVEQEVEAGRTRHGRRKQ